jgi:glucose/mannose transport system permease protein
MTSVVAHTSEDRRSALEPSGRRPARLTPARIGLYGFMLTAVAFFVLPLYIMVSTSLKPLEETLSGGVLALPLAPTFAPWAEAWSSACTGLTCEGLQPGFLNSVAILVPSVLLSLALGAINGYALSFWRVPWANLLFGGLVIGAFIPFQVLIYPLVRITATLRLTDTLFGITLVHAVFQMPIVTLLFRNYFSSLPGELFKAAKMDGAGFFRIFFSIMLPMSFPIVTVALILLTTHIWNDYILGLTFAGRQNFPMTVQLNNIMKSESSVKLYNVEMAAVLLTTLVPLIVYFVSGRWFIRGIAAGAVKG